MQRDRKPINAEGHVIGDQHHRTKISNAEVEQMRFLREALKLTLTQIVRLTGRSTGTVSAIIYYTRRNHTVRGFKE